MNWYHNGYSEEAKDEMRAETENRVQAMQERAKLINEVFAPPEEIRAEAENRARSMQEQARRISDGFRQQERSPPPPPDPSPGPPPGPSPGPPFGPPPGPSPGPPFGPPPGPSPGPPPRPPCDSLFFGLDGDRLIILALLWILWKEHCDAKLLLALLYLLL